MDELNPFGGPGDPLVGDFSGELLLKTTRPDYVPTEEERKIAEEFWPGHETDEGYEKAREMLIERYGEEEGEILIQRIMAEGTFSASWECRDCIVLSDEDFFRKVNNKE